MGVAAAQDTPPDLLTTRFPLPTEEVNKCLFTPGLWWAAQNLALCQEARSWQALVPWFIYVWSLQAGQVGPAVLRLRLLRVPGAPQGSEHQGQMGLGHRNPSRLCDTTCAQSCPLYLDYLKRGVRKRQPPMCRMRFPRHSFHSLFTLSHLFGEASPSPPPPCSVDSCAPWL